MDATVPPPEMLHPGRRRPLPLVILAGLLVPGAGQLVVGRFVQALLMGVAIVGLFVGGLALTGWTAIQPMAHKLEFAAQVFGASLTAVAWWLTEGTQQTEFLRWLDVGRLYVVVASLLNIVAICDAVGAALEHNDAVDARREILRQRALEARARVAEAEAEAVALDIEDPVDSEEPVSPEEPGP